MNTSFRALILAAAGLATGPCSAQVEASIYEENYDYRTFTGANGKEIQAVLIDKGADGLTLLLENGKRATIPADKLSEADRDYVANWSKEKAVFLNECRGLTVKELLELRGYEAIPVRFENNSIHVDGKLNDRPARFLIDTGAGSSLLHTTFAEECGCEVGPMDEMIYGVAGEQPAGWTTAKTIQLGESVFSDRRILATDLKFKRAKEHQLTMDAIFGAEFLKTLDTVISYRERLMFLRPELSDDSAIGEGVLGSRIFKLKDGKVLRGSVTSKTTTAVTLELPGGGERQLLVSQLVPEDQAFVRRWSEAGSRFLRYCGGLTVEELLELRRYQSFEYERRGTHIFVDGALNGRPVTYMIDTGADNSLLHLYAAKQSDCDIGPMTEKIQGIGGTAPAAVTKIDELRLGEAVFNNRKVLSADLARFREDDQLGYAGLFGADFMRELDAVISYREDRVFLKERDH